MMIPKLQHIGAAKRRAHTVVTQLKVTKTYIHKALVHFYYCWLNNQTASHQIKQIVKASIPVLVWLMLFNGSGYIPKDWKPTINVRLLLRLDKFVFDDYVGSRLSNICLAIGGYLLYQQYQHDRRQKVGPELSPVQCLPIAQEPRSKSPAVNTPSIKDPEFELEFDMELDSSRYPFVTDLGGFQMMPIVTIVLGWVILNFINDFKEPMNKAKTIVAIVFYLISHIFMVPVFMAYMYLFHPSSVLKQYVGLVGVQNIVITITHLIFPNVPPIFIQYYGENKVPSYDVPGYSEGLTRIETFKFNSVINAVIHYVKTIDFGIFPSLHSSITILLINFLMDLLTYNSLKLVMLMYLMVQIWSSLYLDHHWRLDILFSFVYSNVFYVYCKFKWPHPITPTMGSRLFQHTYFQTWFNPYKSDHV